MSVTRASESNLALVSTITSTALAARFTEAPHVGAASNAEQRLADWLAALEPKQSEALGALLDHPFASDILTGIAEFSPYLLDVVRADAARLTRLFAYEPEQHLAALIETAARA